MLEFIEVSKNGYLVKNITEVEKHISSIIISISDDIKYETVLNDTLFRTLFSRSIASSFIKARNDVVLQQEFVSVTAELSNGSKVVLSVGVLLTDTDRTYLNGVLNI